MPIRPFSLLQQDLAFGRKMIRDERRLTDAQIDQRALGYVMGDTPGDFIAAEKLVVGHAQFSRIPPALVGTNGIFTTRST